jgi:ComF family protein
MLAGKIIQWLRPGARHVLDLLLPPNCLACDTVVEAEGQFCLSCFRKASFISAPMCRHCGVPLPHGHAVGASGLCLVCAAAPPAFTRARAALRYDALAQGLILPFKHADRTEAAQGLALLMARAGAKLLAECDLLVPVPLHAHRLRLRRYNQSALLATALGRIAGRPVLRDALLRNRATAVLGPLGFGERRSELEGAICVRERHKNRLAGQTILLIDDVMTSGATANACALALRNAGAKRIDVLTAARVPDPRLE